jgi:hypothetical protein
MGALPALRVAVDPAANSSDYYVPNGFLEQGGYPVIVQSNAASHNLVDTQRLWEIPEELTGVRYLSTRSSLNKWPRYPK